MRVTIITTHYPPSVGGAQHLSHRLAEGLALRGHAVDVVTTGPHIEAGEIGTPRGRATVHRYPVAHRTMAAQRAIGRAVRRARSAIPPNGSTRSGLVAEGPVSVGPIGLRFWRAATRACFTSDVVIGVAMPYSGFVLPGLVRNRYTAKAVGLPLHHPRPGRRYSRLSLYALRRLDLVVPLTQSERETFEGLRAHCSAPIPPGCDPDPDLGQTSSQARAELGLRDQPTLGYIGRFAAYKGIDTVLEAAVAIAQEHPHVYFLIAGSGQGSTAVESQLDRARVQLGERLTIFRDFDDTLKRTLIAACDVVALPSREESFGLTMLEAWSAGRPTVSADIPPVRSTIENGGGGLLVPIGSPVELAHAVLTLLTDEEQSRSLGRTGRKRVEREFVWDAVIDQWCDLLSQLEMDHRGIDA